MSKNHCEVPMKPVEIKAEPQQTMAKVKKKSLLVVFDVSLFDLQQKWFSYFLRQRWVDALRRENFTPSNYAVVCSKHFREQDLDRTSLCYVRIRDGAVPSIFEAFPQYLKTEPKFRKPPTIRVPSSSAGIPEGVSSSNLNILHADAQLLNSSFVPGDLELPDTNANTPEDHVSPQKITLKRKVDELQSKLEISRKRIKVLQQNKRRLGKKIGSLNNVIADLKKQNFLSTDSLSILQHLSGGVGDLLRKQLSKHLGGTTPASYSPELRSFALTLYFYSPQAYQYVRKTFDTCLPHPRTIGKWYETVDGSPGLTGSAFAAIEARSSVMSAKGKRLVCALMMDEMALRDLKRKCNFWLTITCYRIISRSFSAVITFHNRENRAKGGGICVANHTSPIDIAILGCDNCYAMVGQEQGGFMGFLQRAMLRSEHHIWFQRSEVKDRMAVTHRLQEHIEDKNKLPILIFPEGTCINNTSIMMFKKGSFEVGGTIYPVAIKYDSRFADPFWNSSIQTLSRHLVNILTSWALVCDVWYLPPEHQRPNETVIEFTKRVKAEIARQGGLVDLEWDGSLKREKPKASFLLKQQEEYSKRIM